MKYRLLGACLLGVAFLGAGCGLQPGSSTIKWETVDAQPPQLIKATIAADYKLYPSDGGEPLCTVHLDTGDQYGFVTDSDGKVVGFANGQKYPLTAKLATSYSWKVQK
jgi:hypothetical protein